MNAASMPEIQGRRASQPMDSGQMDRPNPPSCEFGQFVSLPAFLPKGLCSRLSPAPPPAKTSPDPFLASFLCDFIRVISTKLDQYRVISTDFIYTRAQTFLVSPATRPSSHFRHSGLLIRHFMAPPSPPPPPGPNRGHRAQSDLIKPVFASGLKKFMSALALTPFRVKILDTILT